MSGAIGVLEEFGTVLRRLAELDPATLGGGDSVVGLHRQLESLGAVTARATAAFDASGAWQDDGAQSAAAWVSVATNLPMSTARRRVRLGRALRHLPEAESAWLAGEVGEAQVGLLARARTPATAECLARDEAMLVEHARKLRFGAFSRVLAYWVLHADPDGGEKTAKAHHDSRRFHHSQSFDGRWLTDGLFDAIGGTIVDDELRRIDEELFRADWVEAKARVGEGVSAADLARTPAQRRADALVEMARRSASAAVDGRRPEPLFSVLVGYETFAGMMCQLANGTVVSPGSLEPWLDEAWVERVIFDGPSRVIDVGVRQRLFSGATRRAVQVRDQACFHPTCDFPAEQCEIDHIRPWAEGGLTVQTNGRPACDFHNRHRRP